MKVLIINSTKFDLDGITNSIMNYYRYMDKSDMEIDFLIPNKAPSRLRSEIEENEGKIFELLMRNKNPFLYFLKLTKIISKGNYDIVHAHGNSCTLAVEMAAAKVAGIKIRISHSRNTMCKHRKIHRVLRPLFELTCNNRFACGVEAGKWLFNEKKFTVITNGNDIKKFAYNDYTRKIERDRFNLTSKKVIGHVGTFNEQKNHEFLIDIFYELSKISDDYVLVLVGDGPLRKDIEKKVKQKGLNNKVIFVGKSLEVNKIIQAMDIMIFPSRYEGLPNVVIEWQIAGLPSLISNRITREVKLTSLVNFVSLEDSPKKWAERVMKINIVDRSLTRNRIINDITEAGFNVEENSKDLKLIYENLVSSK